MRALSARGQGVIQLLETTNPYTLVFWALHITVNYTMVTYLVSFELSCSNKSASRQPEETGQEQRKISVRTGQGQQQGAVEVGQLRGGKGWPGRNWGQQYLGIKNTHQIRDSE